LTRSVQWERDTPRHAGPFAELDICRRVERMGSLLEWALALPAQGRYTFTTAETGRMHSLD